MEQIILHSTARRTELDGWQAVIRMHDVVSDLPGDVTDVCKHEHRTRVEADECASKILLALGMRRVS